MEKGEYLVGGEDEIQAQFQEKIVNKYLNNPRINIL